MIPTQFAAVPDFGYGISFGLSRAVSINQPVSLSRALKAVSSGGAFSSEHGNRLSFVIRIPDQLRVKYVSLDCIGAGAYGK